jgi:DNA polymerase-1
MSALANVVHEHLGILLNKESQRSDWSRRNLSDKQISYALKDTGVLLELVDVLIGKLSRLGMDSILDLESRAFTATVDMSLNGFPADKGTAIAMSEKYLAESEAALAEVHALLPPGPSEDGREWTFTGDAHVREILTKLGADLRTSDYPKTAKTGEPSTSRDALATIKGPKAARRWAQAYLGWKALDKLYRDFAKQYVSLIREDGSIKGSFDTVSTGRLSCRRPNLQQVPKRGETQSELGMRLRSIFRPREGEAFICADFSQVELLLAGTIAARETGQHGHMLEVFKRGEIDIHTATAASLTGKDPGEITKSERGLAKATNFGLIYGAKADTLRKHARNNYQIEMTLKEAETYRTAFFERYPELASWHRLVEAECRRGIETSTTPMGRLRKLPVWMNSGDPAHMAGKNAPIQGCAADSIKLTMARLFEDRASCSGNPRLNASVHDEVVLSVEAEHAERVVEWVRSHMADAEREAVKDPDSPIVVDVEARDSWA